MVKDFEKKQKGAALIIVIMFFIAISLTIMQSATVGVIVELRTYRTLATSKFAYMAAEAGVEDIFYRIINDKNIPTSETIVLNGATSTVTIESISATQKEVFAKGDANNEIRKLFFSTSKSMSVSFPYGAQVGEGGMTMGQNVTIDGTGLDSGDVYSDGQIVGANGVVVTGNVISSSGLIADELASSTSCVTEEEVGKTSPNLDYAQSFRIATTTSMPLAKVSLYIKRKGNATGGNIRIAADAGGHPDTTALATQSLPYSSVSTTIGWVEVGFTNPPTLFPATTYWIVFDSTESASKHWYWCRGSTDTYSVGSALYKADWSTAGAWSSVMGDFAFVPTLGGGVSKIDNVEISGTAKADAISNSVVVGDAYYQTISGTTVGGSSCPNANCYPSSPTPPYVPLPITPAIIAQWKSDGASGGIISGDCGTGGVVGCDTFPLTLGPKQINGDLIITDNNKTLTVSGTLYITGDLSISNGSRLQCDPAYLAKSCLIVTDGVITVSNNATFGGSGTAPSYIMLLSRKKNCNGPGSSGTGCSYNQSAIALQNNVDGALFYTSDSMIDISNGAIVTAVVGYKLNLDNTSGVHYNSTVADLMLTPSPAPTTGAWSANRWSEY